jgi:TPR repeat protein
MTTRYKLILKSLCAFLLLYSINVVAGTTDNEVKKFNELKAQAEIGNSGAQYHLASCYMNGQGTGKSMELAVLWWRKAADQGLVQAQTALGLCYLGLGGVPKDASIAAQWFKKASDNKYPRATFYLGTLYSTGEGVEKDINLATALWKKAALAGSADAQDRIAYCYLKGDGVPKSEVEAYAYWAVSGKEVGGRSVASLMEPTLPKEKLGEAIYRAEELRKEIAAKKAEVQTSK